MSKYLLFVFVALFALSGVAKADNHAAVNNLSAEKDFIIEGKDNDYKAGDHEDEYGTTNPDELSLNSYISRMGNDLKNGKDFVCSLGYLATKSGKHQKAVKIFNKCSEHGNQGSKVWMSYMYQNGYGVKKDPIASTAMVKEAADANYSVGQFNYGLALIKGYGVKRDVETGKSLVFKAAKQGDRHAKMLVDSNFNPDSVTPDSDQPDSQPLF